MTDGTQNIVYAYRYINNVVKKLEQISLFTIHSNSVIRIDVTIYLYDVVHNINTEGPSKFNDHSFNLV